MRNRHGFSLVEMLVVVVVLVVLGATLMSVYAGKGKAGEKRRAPMQKARDVECKEYLRQNRLMIQTQQMSDPDSKFPAALSELRLGQQVSVCPEGKEPYQYDSTTGEVRCVHPGHESL